MKRYLALMALMVVAGFQNSVKPTWAIEDEERRVEAKIVEIIEEKEIEVMEGTQLYQKIKLVIIEGVNKNKDIVVESGTQPIANTPKFEKGQKVYLKEVMVAEGQVEYVIDDYVRYDGLIVLALIFGLLTVLVARGKGASSIVSMGFTFLIIFVYILPQISEGKNPVLIASSASILIIPISFYLSHGINKKTSAAILGSLISLGITTFLAWTFINLVNLNGLSSEEAGMLSVEKQGLLNMKGLLLAGIVVGALGVLDDITVSQAAIVEELASAKITKAKELYLRAMNIGRDHISSMVNTLVLAYAGASLPLLLIFIGNPHPLGEILNYEMIAEEIVRTLVGSIGLIVAVPITTLIAARWFRREK